MFFLVCTAFVDRGFSVCNGNIDFPRLGRNIWCCLELVLETGRDWQTPLTRLFDRLYPNKWAFFAVELEHSQPTFHLLCCNCPPVSSSKRDDTPDSTEPSSQVSSPGESVSESTGFSIWIVPVTRIAISPTTKKMKVVKKVIKKKSPATDDPEDIGERKKVRVLKKKIEKKSDTPEREVATPDSLAGSITISIHSSSGSLGTADGNELQHVSNDSIHFNGIQQKLNEKEKGTNSTLNELHKKLVDSGCESTSTIGENLEVNKEPNRLNSQLRRSISRKSLTPDRRLDPIYEGKGRKERSISPVKVHMHEIVCRSNTPTEFPVIALQLILGNFFSYEQLGRLRMVHPHWDEICGQLLNSGYYKLLERSDKLLMALQRKLPADPSLHYPTSVLTNIQVHILNPVDIMRAVLDEVRCLDVIPGVCCFPYGVILDKTFLLLEQIELMLRSGDQVHKITISNFYVATIALKAVLVIFIRFLFICINVHILVHIFRLGENLRLKAAQRIIRLDSFMVESTVTKLEKEALKVKDDFKWKMDHLEQQNNQLRKDNRQLKQDYMRLESRVEVLEQKFKTMARLLS
uniref:PAX3-and PAX7-binding protein 1 n=1 Tax=Heterorhabditis bacteriophora TaxID=37862 RepID=A0A1I7XR48_HETBA